MKWGNVNKEAIEKEPAADESIDEFLDWLKTQPSTGRSREEIDQQTAEERAGWEK